MNFRPSNVPEWRTFLRDYSAKFLADSNPLRELEENGAGEFVRSHVQREGWIGYEPANEDAVTAVEGRLGVRLPPMYRNFLLASNGYGFVDFVDLLAVDEIGWLPDRDPELVDAWSNLGGEDSYREFFQRSLLIAQDDGGPGVCWLLHADDSTEDPEWTAYEWFTGGGSAPTDDRYDNFRALLMDATHRLDVP